MSYPAPQMKRVAPLHNMHTKQGARDERWWGSGVSQHVVPAPTHVRQVVVVAVTHKLLLQSITLDLKLGMEDFAKAARLGLADTPVVTVP